MTNQQKQHLLAYLGYYTGAIDGIWGSKSKEATENFQKDYGLTVDGVVGPDTEKALRGAVAGTMQPVTSGHPPDTGTFWDEIQYFTREEFRCQCGGKYCGGFPAEPNEQLVRIADEVRAHFGRPAHRTSGLRCPQHNKNEGGVSNSRHLTGKALDFWIEGVSGGELLAYVQSRPGIRYAYRIKNGNCVHMDVL